jgi:hypothetical protein
MGLQRQVEGEGRLDGSLHVVDNTVVRVHQHAAGAKRGTQFPMLSGVVAAATARRSIFERQTRAGYAAGAPRDTEAMAVIRSHGGDPTDWNAVSMRLTMPAGRRGAHRADGGHQHCILWT